MSDYAYYHAALDGQKPEASPDLPQSGFYRAKGSDGTYFPIAYWIEDGVGMRCRRGGQDVEPIRAAEMWSWCCDKPITHAVYLDVIEGKPWPDIDPLVAAQTGANAPDRHGIGGNQPPEVMLKEQIEQAKAGVDGYRKIESDEVRDRAQSLRSRLLELKGQAEKTHKKLKQPFLDGGKAIDQLWLPLAREAEAAANAIRSALSDWETEKANRARAAQAAAEAARLKAEAEMKAAAAAGAPPEELFRAAVAATAAPPPPPASTAPIRGGYGRAASVKTVRVATITDQDAVYAFFRGRTEVADLLAKLAQKAVDEGQTVPGTTVEEKRRVA